MEALFGQYEQNKHIGHILLIKLKDGVSEETIDLIVEQIKSWAQQSEDLSDLKVGKHIKPAYDITAAKYGSALAYEIGAYMTFKDAAAELRFLQSPLMANTMKQVIEHIEAQKTVMLDFYA